MKQIHLIPLLLLTSSLLFTACDTTSSDVEDELFVLRASDVEADPGTRDPQTGQLSSNNTFTLYSLADNEIVLSSNETDPAVRAADSASTAWDIGFKGTTIIFNGGTSGPGQASAQILEAAFGAVTEAPTSGYIQDGQNSECPGVVTPAGTFPGAPYAICTGDENGWYDYQASANLITPIAGRTIVMTTATGAYAKLRILSYYKGAPSSPDPLSDEARFYTFEYVLQDDGSTNLSAN